jgi:type IV secretion system protein VirD4
MSAPFEADPAARLRRLLQERRDIEGRAQSCPSSSGSSDIVARLRRRIETPAPAVATRPMSTLPAVTPSPIPLAFYLNEKTGEPEKQLFYHGERGVLVFGLNGAGKSTRFLIELLMTVLGWSIVVLDIKQELAAQTADERKKFGDVKIAAPYGGKVGLTSDGYNPGCALNPNNEDEFSDRAALMADAVVELDGKETHWSESARGLMQAAIMFEAQRAARERRPFSMLRVRKLLCEPDKFETVKENGKPVRKQVAGLAVNARRMIDEGGEIVAQLVGRFVREHGMNELAGIQSTFDTQTRFLLSPPIARDLDKGNWSFRQLRERPTTVYICLTADEITRKRRWTRLLLTDALCEMFRPGPVRTLFILDEYRAAVGEMSLINDVWALVRGYGVTLMPFLQSAVQLKKLLGEEWENFAAQAGITLTIGPPNDLFSAKWMSERCGVTTVAQAGFNLGDGVNSGSGVNAGTGMNDSGYSSNEGSGQNFGRNESGGLSVQQVERRAFLPQELMDMKAGECRAWLPGFGTKSVPLFAPNFWNRKADWVARVRPNPYRKG